MIRDIPWSKELLNKEEANGGYIDKSRETLRTIVQRRYFSQ
ncbi:1618_t:CDS:2 [Cetraspora pellucida]|uniref:1618_t:CDS:1 n=1 Tax=Cetraspora pellucida TaxID=1433469 RepID=A0A9N9FWV2_9GLOM|nr:1618_t:CDS:2 [Cetraspora pellucida]